jgi:hypothetical protein
MSPFGPTAVGQRRCPNCPEAVIRLDSVSSGSSGETARATRNRSPSIFDARANSDSCLWTAGWLLHQDAAPLDIASAEGLKRALLAAKSVAHSKEGQSGVAAVKIMDRLGIAEEMKPRIVIETLPGGSVTAVVEGKAELGFALVSELVPVPEVKLVGPVPGDLQSYIVFAAGVSRTRRMPPRRDPSWSFSTVRARDRRFRRRAWRGCRLILRR